MCGLITTIGIPDCAGMLERGRLVQAHRGPDDQGKEILFCGPWEIGFGHQRLSIFDLSMAGHQPFRRNDSSDVLVFNGEIFNFLEIRRELGELGWSFTSQTDTEVVLAALRQWGPQAALTKFIGMFALVWFDAAKEEIILGRDRLGKKPLYFTQAKGQFLIASEVKTLLAMSNRKFPLNLQVVGEFLYQLQLDTSAETFFQGIYQFPPAHFGCIKLPRDQEAGLGLEMTRFWSLPEQFTPNPETSPQVITDRLLELFTDSVKLRMRSDVPVGILLSGGIDSSSIAAVATSLCPSHSPPELFSVVCDDSRFDESAFVDIVARHLKTTAHKINLSFTPDVARDLLKHVCWHNDAPVGSLSNIAFYLLMKKARELGITVLLSGQGGDELLCGYRKFLGFYLQELFWQGHWPKAAAVAWEFFRNKVLINEFEWSEAKRYLPGFLAPSRHTVFGPAMKNRFTPLDLYFSRRQSCFERQKLDLTRFSVPILLHYEDRLSMAESREIRTPFLDFRVIEFLLSLPTSWKLSQGWSKYVFRRAISPLLPPEIVWRKDKKGFDTPQSEWLKNDLADLVQTHTGPKALMCQAGLLDSKALQAQFSQFRGQKHGKGRVASGDILAPLSFEMWLQGYEKYVQFPS